jgi:hypothetical protein
MNTQEERDYNIKLLQNIIDFLKKQNSDDERLKGKLALLRDMKLDSILGPDEIDE